ncbi:uncharacterized protein A4U43_C01F11320 [Asparagus officinalis]|uniref:Uncharacterized protein n=1 Tax=Asparagus officinalis TaxID=4686 RepID=A0A5P1FT73_ASPOF|nr:uncharacterized protein A4U43_C01F11320 [Asparagus officinalis]
MAEEEVAPPIGLEYPYPHLATEIEEEEWDRMRQYLIRTSRVGPRYVREPDLEHRYGPARHLNIRGWSLVLARLSRGGVDSERAAETPSPRASEVDRLRIELEESKMKAKRLDEAL